MRNAIFSVSNAATKRERMIERKLGGKLGMAQLPEELFMVILVENNGLGTVCMCVSAAHRDAKNRNLCILEH